MLHIHGTYHIGKKLVACRNDYCTNCQRATFTEGYRSFRIFHYWYIPLLPLGFHVRWFCIVCGKDPEKKRPDKPGILIAGMLAGALLMFIGVMVAIEKKSLESWPALVIGAVMIAALGFALKHRSQTAYADGKKSVPPLSGDRCPYCEKALTPNTKPVCHECNVRIYT